MPPHALVKSTIKPLALGALLLAVVAVSMLYNLERGAAALMWLAYPGLLLLTLPADALLDGGLVQSPVAGTLIVWLAAWLTLSALAFAAAWVWTRLRPRPT